jgi:soluble lytic murein transglycosylase-like protein
VALLRVIAALAIPLALPSLATASSALPRISIAAFSPDASHFFVRDDRTHPALSANRSVRNWDDFTTEAAARFDFPIDWIRAVMRAESNGRAFVAGAPITSPAGAIGLMQVMPETYAELAQRYGLDDEPGDPRDNILAGTAYLRELYDRFGAPDFLAAYNAGPGRFQSYRAGLRPLPDETSRYLERLRPTLAGALPQAAGTTFGALRDRPTPFSGGPLFFAVKQPRITRFASLEPGVSRLFFIPKER